MKIKGKIVKNFILFALPCLYVWGFTLYCIFGNLNFDTGIPSINSANIVAMFQPDNIGSVLIQLILFFPLVVLVFLLTVFLMIFWIPISFFTIGFRLDNLLVWLMIINFIIIFIAAFYFKFGKFQEDSSYVSGSHYEATVKSNDKVVIKEVKEYSGGGEVITNMLLFILRMIIIAVAGIIIFFVELKKNKNNDENNDENK